MEYIEVSAKTVDDAITEALVKLGVTSDQLEYEVIEKGSTGFLGIGSKNAVRFNYYDGTNTNSDSHQDFLSLLVHKQSEH